MKTATMVVYVCPGGLRCRHGGPWRDPKRAPHTIMLWGEPGKVVGAEVNGERVVTHDDRVWFSNQAVAMDAVAEHIRRTEARIRLLAAELNWT